MCTKGSIKLNGSLENGSQGLEKPLHTFFKRKKGHLFHLSLPVPDEFSQGQSARVFRRLRAIPRTRGNNDIFFAKMLLLNVILYEKCTEITCKFNGV